jgi:hypothetical protein
MADLTDIQAAQSVKLIGSDATGLETTPVASDAAGNLFVNIKAGNVPNTAGVNSAITVGTSAIEAKVGSVPLTNRISLTAFHNGNGKLYWGYNNSVTTTNGTQIFKNTTVSWDIGPNVHVWLISDTASQDVRITEAA